MRRWNADVRFDHGYGLDVGVAAVQSMLSNSTYSYYCQDAVVGVRVCLDLKVPSLVAL